MAIYVVYLLLIAACTALQHTWPAWLLLWGRPPDLALGVVVCAALTGGPVLGCYTGFCSGLLVGSTESALLGGYFIAYMGTGTALGWVRGSVFADRVMVAVVVVLCTAPVVDVIRLIFAPPASPGPWLIQTIVGAPYSALAAAPIYLLVRSIVDRLSETQ